MKWLVRLVLALVALAGIGYAAWTLTPWPKALLIRYAFAEDARKRNASLEALVPPVEVVSDIRYADSPGARLDVYRPKGDGPPLPTILWIHGGAFVAGDKSDTAPYLKILAAQGYTVVNVDYQEAPEGKYPLPVLQARDALAWALANAGEHRVDRSRLFLAGDSAGSQITAQLAASIADPAYGRRVGVKPPIDIGQVRGVILFCGVYDAERMNFDGPFGGFLRTTMWSYFGKRDFADDPRLAEFAVNRHVTTAFPPTFLSVGNGDPLKPQTLLMTAALQAKGVSVDTLFFPEDHQPELAHEYQFDLNSRDGKLAFERLTAFLESRSRG